MFGSLIGRARECVIQECCWDTWVAPLELEQEAISGPEGYRRLKEQLVHKVGMEYFAERLPDESAVSKSLLKQDGTFMIEFGRKKVAYNVTREGEAIPGAELDFDRVVKGRLMPDGFTLNGVSGCGLGFVHANVDRVRVDSEGNVTVNASLPMPVGSLPVQGSFHPDKRKWIPGVTTFHPREIEVDYSRPRATT